MPYSLVELMGGLCFDTVCIMMKACAGCVLVHFDRSFAWNGCCSTARLSVSLLRLYNSELRGIRCVPFSS